MQLLVTTASNKRSGFKNFHLRDWTSGYRIATRKKRYGFEGWHAWLNRRHLQESKVIIHFCSMQCTAGFQDEHDQTSPCSRDAWGCADFPASPHYWILVLSSSSKIKHNGCHSACKIAYRREKGVNYLQLSTGKLLEDIMRIKVFGCQLCECIHVTVPLTFKQSLVWTTILL